MTDRRYMLDTDTVSFVLRGQGEVGPRLLEHAPSQICLSSISLAELRCGAEKRRSKRLHQLIDTFTKAVQVVLFDEASATVFGRVATALATKGAPIGTFDTLIAAHALSLNLTLVTNNTKHFQQVVGIKLQNWFVGRA